MELPVTVLTTVLRMLGGLISSFKTLDSVASGKPLSSISSRSCEKESKAERQKKSPDTVVQ